MFTLGTRPRRTASRAAALLLVLIALLALVACGGSGTVATSSPSAAAGGASVLPTEAGLPSATPLPAPTIAGTIAFSGGDTAGGRDDIFVVRTDGTGLARLTSGTASLNEHPSWSPDGERIVYHSGDGPLETFAIRIMNADGSNDRRLSTPGVSGIFPSWSPDGSHIAFTRWRNGSDGEQLTIAIMNADGSHLRDLTSDQPDDSFATWASNDRVLFLRRGDVYAAQLAGGRVTRVTRTGRIEDYALSPDGKSLVVDDSERGILVVPLRGDGAAVTLLGQDEQRELGGVASPGWAPGGRAVVLALSDWGLEPDAGTSLYIVNTDGTGRSVVPGVSLAYDPVWRPE